MIEFNINSIKFKKIHNDGYIDLIPLYFIDKKGNEFPSNIYKLLSEREIKKLNPILDEQYSEVFNNNCKLFFCVNDRNETKYYISNTITAYPVYSKGVIRVNIEKMINVQKKEYKRIKNNSRYQKESLKYFDITIERLLDVNKRLLISIKNNETTSKLIKTGTILLKSQLSNSIYCYKVASYKISNDQKSIKVRLANPNQLKKEDSHYFINHTQDNNKNKIPTTNKSCYKSAHIGQSVLLVNNSIIKDVCVLKLKMEAIDQLNSAITNGMIKYVFNRAGTKRRIKTVTAQSYSDYIEYKIEFYQENQETQLINDYLKNKEKHKIINYDEIGTNTTIAYYKVTNKQETKHYQGYESKQNKENQKTIKKTRLNIVDELQIINSNNNHVTKKHKVLNKIMYIKVQPAKYDSTNILIEYKGHYCDKCNKYFDFKQSFLNQLKDQRVSICKIATKLIDDEERIIDKNKLRYELYNKESILHSYGYKVGASGRNKTVRQSIIDKVIQENILTLAEVKDTLNRNISTFKRNRKRNLSVKHWEEDLKYINQKYY